MKSVSRILFASLLSISLQGVAAESEKSLVEITNLDLVNLLRVAPCKASGDGTYTEMITTMASVLPPAEAQALLDRYCDDCNRRKFAAGLPR